MDDNILLEFDNKNILDSMNLVDHGIVRTNGVIVLEMRMKFSNKRKCMIFIKICVRSMIPS